MLRNRTTHDSMFCYFCVPPQVEQAQLVIDEPSGRALAIGPICLAALQRDLCEVNYTPRSSWQPLTRPA